jgi:hypothetical protein
VKRRIFFRKINVFLFLNITFPLGHVQNVRMRLEIQSLLVCTAVFSTRCRPTFQRCVLPPHHRPDYGGSTHLGAGDVGHVVLHRQFYRRAAFLKDQRRLVAALSVAFPILTAVSTLLLLLESPLWLSPRAVTEDSHELRAVSDSMEPDNSARKTCLLGTCACSRSGTAERVLPLPADIRYLCGRVVSRWHGPAGGCVRGRVRGHSSAGVVSFGVTRFVDEHVVTREPCGTEFVRVNQGY